MNHAKWITIVSLILITTFFIACENNGDDDDDNDDSPATDDDDDQTEPSPFVYYTKPAADETNIKLKEPILFYFTEQMKQSTVEEAFTLQGSGGENVEGSFLWNTESDILTFTPDQPYPNADNVKVEIGTGATSEAGIQMETSFSLAFMTMNLWSLTYTETTGEGREILVDSDDNIYVTGSYVDQDYHYDVFLWKLDPAGNFLWQRVWDESFLDTAHGLCMDDFGDLIVAGYTFGATNTLDILILKYDPEGQLIWAKPYDFALTDDFGMDVAVDSGGNIYVAGYTQIVSDVYHLAVIKTDSDGNLLWKKSEPLIGTFDESRAFGIAAMDDFGVIVAGSASNDFSSTNEDSEAVLIHYDPDGNKDYQIITGQPVFYDFWMTAHIDYYGRAYVGGFSEIVGAPEDKYSDVKEFYPELGLDKWSVQFTSHDQSIWGMTSTIGGDLYLAGKRSKDLSGTNKAWIAKLSSGVHEWDLDLAMSSGYSIARGVAVDSIGWVYSTGFKGDLSRSIWVRKCDPDGYCGQ